MEIMEIFSDALVYPFKNIKALIIYMILGIILGIVIMSTFGAMLLSDGANNLLALLGSGILGIIITLILAFMITGYELDIVKFGIMRDDGAPGIDFVRQFVNGVKTVAVYIVYMLIPLIVSAILAIIFQNWLAQILAIIVGIIFSFALIMAECRLAKTEELGSALAIGDAIGDISKVGIVKVILFVIVLFIIAFILYFFVFALAQWNAIFGGILFGILVVYITFFSARATGLLYSDV